MKKTLLLFAMGCTLQVSYAQNELSRPDVPGELMIDIGLNYLTETPSELTQRGWPSKSIGLYYTKRKILNRNFVFNYGLGLGLEKLDFGNQHTLIQDGDELIVDEFPFSDSPSKNRLAITYFESPLEMRFYPKGTEDGRGWFFSVGTIGGLRLSSHTKWKYPEDGNDRVQKISGSFDLNQFRYGYQLRFGFRGSHVFFKQYLSDVFNNPVEGTNPRMFTVGINLSGF